MAAMAKRQQHYLRRLRSRLAKAERRFAVSMRALKREQVARAKLAAESDELGVSISISITIRL